MLQFISVCLKWIVLNQANWRMAQKQEEPRDAFTQTPLFIFTGIDKVFVINTTTMAWLCVCVCARLYVCVYSSCVCMGLKKVCVYCPSLGQIQSDNCGLLELLQRCTSNPQDPSKTMNTRSLENERVRGRERERGWTEAEERETEEGRAGKTGKEKEGETERQKVTDKKS